MSDAADTFTALFRLHYAKVLAYASRRVGPELAQDVAADTMMAAWRHIDRLPDNALPWLYRTAANCIANRARGDRRQGRVAGRLMAFRAPADPDHAEAVVETTRISAALARLNPTDREALLLVAWEGLDHRAAASALGCNPVTFRVRLHRARQRLSRLLDEPPARSMFPRVPASVKEI